MTINSLGKSRTIRVVLIQDNVQDVDAASPWHDQISRPEVYADLYIQLMEV
jgi:hypothetical protein